MCEGQNELEIIKFYADYYGANVDLLVEAIRKYKSLNKNKKDELYLCDLLA